MSGWLPKGSRMGQQGIGPDGQQGRGKPRNNPWQGGKNNSGDIMRRLKLTQDDLARPDLNQPEMRTPSLPGHYNFQEDQASRIGISGWRSNRRRSDSRLRKPSWSRWGSRDFGRTRRVWCVGIMLYRLGRKRLIG